MCTRCLVTILANLVAKRDYDVHKFTVYNFLTYKMNIELNVFAVSTMNRVTRLVNKLNELFTKKLF